MLNAESVMYSAKSLFIGIVMGCGLTMLMFRAMVTLGDTFGAFAFPWYSLAECVVVVVLVAAVTMRYSAAKAQEGNIVEILRGVD